MTDIVERLRNRAIATMIIKDKADLFYESVDEIERLRAENEQFFKQAEMNARLLTENADLRGQLAKTDLDNIRINYENEKLREAMSNLKSVFRINMLRAFPETSHEVIDAEISKALGETE